MSSADVLKPLFWVGSALGEVRTFPVDVRRQVGFALYLAQTGGKHVDAKPLRGFAGAGVLEMVEDHDGNTYRAVYTVKFAGAVYALHAFQKKSKKTVRTPKQHLDLVRERLRRAEQHYGERLRDNIQERHDDQQKPSQKKQR